MRTGSCQGGCQTGCQTGCTGSCQNCDGGCNGSCNSGCTKCTSCVGCHGCDGCTGCTGCNGCVGCNSCTSCDGACTSGCDSGCQGGCQGGCQEGCTTGCDGGCQGSCEGGTYCSSTNQCDSNTVCGGNTGSDDHKKKEWHSYCVGINNGGYSAGIINSCTGGGDDGVHSDCPPEWLEEGHTEDEWNNLDYNSQKEFAKAHGYEEVNHDPPSDFVSTSLKDLVNNIPELEGKDIKVETSYDPETGKITQVIKDKNTGEVLITSEQNEDGSFDYKRPDGSLALEGVKTNDKGEITEGTGYGEDGKKTNLSDGSTTMPDPNSGKDVNVPPQGAGC